MKNIKTGWDQISLNEFIAIGHVVADESVQRRPIFARISMLEIISDYTMDECLDMQTDELEEILKQVAFLDEEAPVNDGKPFEIDGVKYREYKAPDMTTGEVISIEMAMASKEGTSLAKQLAIIFRPVTELKFNTDTLDARTKLFGERLTVPNFIQQLMHLEKI